MKKIQLHRLIIFSSIIVISTMMAFALTSTRGKVTIEYEPLADGGIRVLNVSNQADKRIDLKIDGKPVSINANSSAPLNRYASKHVRYAFSTGGGDLLWSSDHNKKLVEEKKPATAIEQTEDNAPVEKKQVEQRMSANQLRKTTRQHDSSSIDYVKRLNQDEFFRMDAVTAYTQKVESLCSSIESSKNLSLIHI